MERNQNGGQQRAARHTAANDLEKELARLATSDLDLLRREWTLKFNAAPPSVRSRDTLLRLLGWQIQATTLGGLDAETAGKLRRIAKVVEADGEYEPRIRRDVSPGVVLTREWKGVIHKVTVTASGFQHLGKQYGSLSDIARTITGTRWSGPRFFGLEQKQQPKPQRHGAPTSSVAGGVP
jgi:hypothetical protein